MRFEEEHDLMSDSRYNQWLQEKIPSTCQQGMPYLLPGTTTMPTSKSIWDFSRLLQLPPELQQVHGKGKKPSSRAFTSKESLKMLQEKTKREKEAEKEQDS